MTAYQESKLLVLANPTVPESLNYPHQGEGTDHDSIGTFQQRPSMGWGTVAQLMDPGYAATKFLTTLAEVPGWQTMPTWQAAQEVQVSADGTALRAVGVAGHRDDHRAVGRRDRHPAVHRRRRSDHRPRRRLPARGLQRPARPDHRPRLPDPAHAQHRHPADGAGLEPVLLGRARLEPQQRPPAGPGLRRVPRPRRRAAHRREKARGDALAASLQASAAQTGVSYLIWYGRIWSVSRADEGWRPYSGGGVYDPGSITGGHYDHLHISVY